MAAGSTGSAPPAQAVGSAPARSGPNYALFIAGGLGLVIIAGLIGFMLYRNNSDASAGEGNPTPRPRNTANTVADVPTATNSTSSKPEAPSSDLAEVEKKAQAFVGKWATQVGKDTFIITYGSPSKQGDTFVINAIMSQKGKADQASTVIFSRDEWIKEIDNTGKETKFKADPSADGSRMAVNLADGLAFTLGKVDPNAQTSGSTTASAPQPAAPKVVKKVDCNKKCSQVFDRCMAEYRQFDDQEMICGGKRESCFSKCS